MLFEVIIFFQAEDGIRDIGVTGVQTCALPILNSTAAASFHVPSPASPARRAAATVSSGRRRLPPAEIRWSASAGITGTGLSIRSTISASTAAMSGLAKSTSRSTDPLGRTTALLITFKPLRSSGTRGHNGDAPLQGQANA